MKYMIVQIGQVDEMLSDGWELYGSVVIDRAPNGVVTMYQGMTKTEFMTGANQIGTV